MYVNEVQREDKFLPSTYLFDYEEEPIKLEEWLNQEILFSNREKDPITIRDLIKNSANKHGGAHLDLQLKSKELFSISLSNTCLVQISKYLLKRLNYNYEEDVSEKLFKSLFKMMKEHEDLN
jgi:hypothetical protein